MRFSMLEDGTVQLIFELIPQSFGLRDRCTSTLIHFEQHIQKRNNAQEREQRKNGVEYVEEKIPHQRSFVVA
jgi:hypothetical protein